VKRLTDIMAEIAAASQEQTSGIEQVNQAIVQMDQVTQQNAALVEEAAAAAESMNSQARSLSEAVSTFKLNAADMSGVARVPGEDWGEGKERDPVGEHRMRGLRAAA
jgi:methyl-accepting chemotaxis protein